MTQAPLRISAAGSIAATIRTAAVAAGLEGIEILAGPGGWLAERIEAGDAPDLYVSASLTGPERLGPLGWSRPVVVARGRMVVMARPGLSLAPEAVEERLLNPTLSIGTSTPGSDPAGDYAAAILGRLDARASGEPRPSARARALVGQRGPKPPVSIVPALLRDGAIDLVLYYETTARAVSAEVPGATWAPVPATLAPDVRYAATLPPGAEGTAVGFLDWLRGPEGQAHLQAAGYLPA